MGFNTMKFGIWFTSVPTAVISTYLTNDLVPVDMTSDLTKPKDWLPYANKIDFCVVTVMDHKGLVKNQSKLRRFVKEMQRRGVDVYLAFICLLGPEKEKYKRMKDSDGLLSKHWICPADKKRTNELMRNIREICSDCKPTGILLWYANFPSENFCYKCEGCLSKYGEFDIDERSTVVTKFLQKIKEEITKSYPGVRVAIEVDVKGETDIEYQFGVHLRELRGIIDDVFFHILGDDEITLKRAFQLSTEARKREITPKFYVSIISKEHLKKIYERLSKSGLDILVYSPTKSSMGKAIPYLVDEKYKKPIKRFFDIGAVFSIAFLIIEKVSPIVGRLEIYLLSVALSVIFIAADLLHRKGKLTFVAQGVNAIAWRPRRRKTIIKSKGGVEQRTTY